MLELRPSCENCKKPLPYDSIEAMVCSFECTFCENCVMNTLENVCPNCGGGFSPRPIRPQRYLEKYPVSSQVVWKPVDKEAHQQLVQKFKNISPEKR